MVELRGITIGWRFISLYFINEDSDRPPARVEAEEQGLRYHRICAAARDRFGNDTVGELYRASGERYRYIRTEGELVDRLAASARRI